jgi:hypothetical protein
MEIVVGDLFKKKKILLEMLEEGFVPRVGRPFQ